MADPSTPPGPQPDARDTPSPGPALPTAREPAPPPTPGQLNAELLAILEPLSKALGHPRVRALHLPPAGAAGDCAAPRRGEFAALEIEGGALGLSYVLLGDALQALRHEEQTRPLQGRRAIDLAQALCATSAAHSSRQESTHADQQAGPAHGEQALAWAAAQALAQALMLRAGWQPPPAADPFASLAPGPGDHLGLVGLFGPLMPRLVATGARITVLELRADWVGHHPGYEVTLDPSALQACNKVLATGTLLLNETLDEVLVHTRQAQQVALIGPTVSHLPEPLFARGVHVLGGTWIQDPAAFVEALRQGAERGNSARKYTLTRSQWPGWRRLLGS